jgi:hypothetical protein
MPYTSDKKPGALTAASALDGANNLVVEQGGEARKVDLNTLEVKLFGGKTAKTTPAADDVVVIRQSDNTLRQVAIENLIPPLAIDNSRISASAAIADIKLATISATGKVLNSATSAVATNTANAIVTRDGAGSFSANTITAVEFVGNLTGTFTGDVVGNAATATKWATARTLALTGDLAASLVVDGSANVSVASVLAATGVAAGTYNNDPAQVRPFTVDTKGRITGVGSAVPIVLPFTSVTGSAFKASARVATTAAFGVAAYNNGSSGVGSTLTGSAVALSIDGVSLSLNDRVLVKDQASAFENGIYIVTNAGSGVANWELTRATDADTAADAAAAVVSATSGTVNGGRTFASSFKATDTVGTTAQTFNRVVNGSITTSELVDATSTITGVTDAKLRHSAGLSVIGRSANSTGAPADITAGTDGHVLRRSGTTVSFGQIATAGIADGAVTPGKLERKLTFMEAKNATGSEVEFTGIPSWARRITVMLNGVSLTGTDKILIQVGTAGGFATSGYVSYFGYTSNSGQGTGTSTAGIGVWNGGEPNAQHAHAVFSNMTGNSWVSSHAGGYPGPSQSGSTGYITSGGGAITLGGVLDRIKIISGQGNPAVPGSNTFDAGSISISYE